MNGKFYLCSPDNELHREISENTLMETLPEKLRYTVEKSKKTPVKNLENPQETFYYSTNFRFYYREFT